MYQARYYEMHGEPAKADALFEEFERTMILAGVNDVAKLDCRHVRRPQELW